MEALNIVPASFSPLLIMMNLKRSGVCRAVAIVAAMILSIFGSTGELRAKVVDSEVLLLVDVSRSVTNSEFDAMMDGLAQVFESSAVIDSIQNGTAGSIAASVVFFSDKNSQAVGIGWMEVSDAASAQLFADGLRAAARSSDKNNAAIASAFDFSVPLFGLETGGVANGFESSNQLMTFAADSTDTSSPAPGGQTREDVLLAASQDAQAAGVDMINAITLGGGSTLVDYYDNFVVGGAVGGQVGGATEAPTVGDFPTAAQSVLGGGIAAAAPEPTVSLLCSIGLMILLRRRR